MGVWGTRRGRPLAGRLKCLENKGGPFIPISFLDQKESLRLVLFLVEARFQCKFRWVGRQVQSGFPEFDGFGF